MMIILLISVSSFCSIDKKAMIKTGPGSYLGFSNPEKYQTQELFDE